MPSETVNSQSSISNNCQAGQIEKDFKDLLSMEDFKNTLTYRQYNFYTDNNTGDLIKTTYVDYQIYGSIQYINPITNAFTQQGQLSVHDVSIFLPAKITTLTNGTSITPIRAKINDEILYSGYTYRIDNVMIEQYADTEIYAECLCKRIDNSNANGII